MTTEDRKIVLVVEDHNAFRKTVTDLITGMGYRVVALEDVAKGRDYLANDGVTAWVCSDVETPGGSGTDLLAYVRETYPTMPVMLMSGRTAEEITERLAPGIMPNAFWQKTTSIRGFMDAYSELGVSP